MCVFIPMKIPKPKNQINFFFYILHNKKLLALLFLNAMTSTVETVTVIGEL